MEAPCRATAAGETLSTSLGSLRKTPASYERALLTYDGKSVCSCGETSDGSVGAVGVIPGVAVATALVASDYARDFRRLRDFFWLGMASLPPSPAFYSSAMATHSSKRLNESLQASCIMPLSLLYLSRMSSALDSYKPLMASV